MSGESFASDTDKFNIKNNGKGVLERMITYLTPSWFTPSRDDQLLARRSINHTSASKSLQAASNHYIATGGGGVEANHKLGEIEQPRGVLHSSNHSFVNQGRITTSESFVSQPSSRTQTTNLFSNGSSVSGVSGSHPPLHISAMGSSGAAEDLQDETDPNLRPILRMKKRTRYDVANNLQTSSIFTKEPDLDENGNRSKKARLDDAPERSVSISERLSRTSDEAGCSAAAAAASTTDLSSRNRLKHRDLGKLSISSSSYGNFLTVPSTASSRRKFNPSLYGSPLATNTGLASSLLGSSFRSSSFYSGRTQFGGAAGATGGHSLLAPPGTSRLSSLGAANTSLPLSCLGTAPARRTCVTPRVTFRSSHEQVSSGVEVSDGPGGSSSGAAVGEFTSSLQSRLQPQLTSNSATAKNLLSSLNRLNEEISTRLADETTSSTNNPPSSSNSLLTTTAAGAAGDGRHRLRNIHTSLYSSRSQQPQIPVPFRQSIRSAVAYSIPSRRITLSNKLTILPNYSRRRQEEEGKEQGHVAPPPLLTYGDGGEGGGKMKRTRYSERREGSQSGGLESDQPYKDSSTISVDYLKELKMPSLNQLPNIDFSSLFRQGSPLPGTEEISSTPLLSTSASSKLFQRSKNMADQFEKLSSQSTTMSLSHLPPANTHSSHVTSSSTAPFSQSNPLKTLTASADDEKWTCDTCLVPNEATKSKCVCCSSDRPAAVAVKSSQSTLGRDSVCRKCLRRTNELTGSERLCSNCAAANSSNRIPSVAAGASAASFLLTTSSFAGVLSSAAAAAGAQLSMPTTATSSSSAKGGFVLTPPSAAAFTSSSTKGGGGFVAPSLAAAAAATSLSSSNPSGTSSSNMSGGFVLPVLTTAGVSSESTTTAGDIKFGFTPSSSTSATRPSDLKWTCSTCLVPNTADKTNCVCCASRKPSPIKHPSSSEISSQMAISKVSRELISPKEATPVSSTPWSCPTCLVRNEADVAKCPCCATGRPSVNQSKAAPTNSSTANSGQNSSNKEDAWMKQVISSSSDSSSTKDNVKESNSLNPFPVITVSPVTPLIFQKASVAQSLAVSTTTTSADSGIGSPSLTAATPISNKLEEFRAAAAAKAQQEQLKSLIAAASKTSAEKKKEREHKWTCPTCGRQNSAARPVCKKCQTPKELAVSRRRPRGSKSPPALVVASPLPPTTTSSQPLSKATPSWRCPGCSRDNSLNAINCLSCGECQAPEDDVQPEIELIEDEPDEEEETEEVGTDDEAAGIGGSAYWRCKKCLVKLKRSVPRCSICGKTRAEVAGGPEVDAGDSDAETGSGPSITGGFLKRPAITAFGTATNTTTIGSSARSATSSSTASNVFGRKMTLPASQSVPSFGGFGRLAAAAAAADGGTDKPSDVSGGPPTIAAVFGSQSSSTRNSSAAKEGFLFGGQKLGGAAKVNGPSVAPAVGVSAATTVAAPMFGNLPASAAPVEKSVRFALGGGAASDTNKEKSSTNADEGAPPSKIIFGSSSTSSVSPAVSQQSFIAGNSFAPASSTVTNNNPFGKSQPPLPLPNFSFGGSTTFGGFGQASASAAASNADKPKIDGDGLFKKPTISFGSTNSTGPTFTADAPGGGFMKSESMPIFGAAASTASAPMFGVSSTSPSTSTILPSGLFGSTATSATQPSATGTTLFGSSGGTSNQPSTGIFGGLAASSTSTTPLFGVSSSAIPTPSAPTANGFGISAPAASAALGGFKFQAQPSTAPIASVSNTQGVAAVAATGGFQFKPFVNPNISSSKPAAPMVSLQPAFHNQPSAPLFQMNSPVTTTTSGGAGGGGGGSDSEATGPGINQATAPGERRKIKAIRRRIAKP